MGDGISRLTPEKDRTQHARTCTIFLPEPVIEEPDALSCLDS